MIYESEVICLIEQWKERAANKNHESSYLDALNECIYDLDTLLSLAFERESPKEPDSLNQFPSEEIIYSLKSHTA